MPNWVKTNLTLTGNKDSIKKLLEKCYSLDEETNAKNFFDFNGVIPMPSHIYRGDLGVKEQEMYGEYNWYDWSRINWGTKWNSSDACYNFTPNGVIVEFQTAWNFPLPIIKAIESQYPDIKVSAMYADEDLGYNCGWYEDGSVTHAEDVWENEHDKSFNFACDVWGYDVDEMREEYGIA